MSTSKFFLQQNLQAFKQTGTRWDTNFSSKQRDVRPSFVFYSAYIWTSDFNWYRQLYHGTLHLLMFYFILIWNNNQTQSFAVSSKIKVQLFGKVPEQLACSPMLQLQKHCFKTDKHKRKYICIYYMYIYTYKRTVKSYIKKSNITIKLEIRKQLSSWSWKNY